MTPRLLWYSGLRHLLRHPWQLALALLGIALGVAVVVAVDLANVSARSSFDRSLEQVSGRATHRIEGDERGIPEAVYRQLRAELGLREAAPAVTGLAEVAEQPGVVLRVLGLDLFAEAPLRSTPLASEEVDITAFLTTPGAALFPPGLTDAATLTLLIGDRRQPVQRLGTLDGPGLDNLLVTDISTAQALLDRRGRLSHINLRLPAGQAGEQQAARVRALLPPPLTLTTVAERAASAAQMSAAFSLNLTAMSLLALLVGLFLIYNAISFSVVQRRALWGMLRALGVSRRELLTVVLGEALLLGLVGTLLGLWLGTGLVGLVTRTINDLYYTLPVTTFTLAPLSLLKGLGLGLAATLVAALLPAYEAAAVPPGSALSRAQLEARWRSALPALVLAGLALLGASWAVFALTTGLVAGFFGLFLLILGCALLTPPLLAGLAAVINRPAQALGLLPAMAIRDLPRHLSRTGIAVAALMVAFAATVGVGVMVDSFRSGVTLWLNDLLNADVYVAPAALGETRGELTLHPATLAALRATPGVAAVSTFLGRDSESQGQPLRLMVVDLAPLAEAGYQFVAGEPARAWAAFKSGDAVLISEPLAYRQALRVGDALTLQSDRGPQAFAIAGVLRDYASEHGRVFMHRATYARYWDDRVIESAAVYAAPGVSAGELRARLEQQAGALQALELRANRDILNLSLDIFERTFTVTQVLRLLAIVIAFVGVLSALLALTLERAREFALLRAIGMLPGELGRLVLMQTGLLGLLAGLFAVPTGLVLAYVLIHVINRRAFGWTLPFQADPGLLLQSVLLAVLAALLAGVYPAWKLARTPPAQALRTE